MTEYEAQLTADVLGVQFGLLRRLRCQLGGIVGCVDGERRNGLLHGLHDDARVYRCAGMTAVMVVVALMTAWASPAARAQAPLSDSFHARGLVDFYVIPDGGGDGYEYNLGGDPAVTTTSEDGDGTTTFATTVAGNPNANRVSVPWFVLRRHVHTNHSGGPFASGVTDQSVLSGIRTCLISSNTSRTGSGVGNTMSNVVNELCIATATGVSFDVAVARRVLNPLLDVTSTVYDRDGEAFEVRCQRNSTSGLAFVTPATSGTSLIKTGMMDTLEGNTNFCSTPLEITNSYNANKIAAASLNTAFNAPMSADVPVPDTASYTYTGTINNETLTTRRTCSVNVVGTPGPNTPCPEGTNPVLYPNSGIPTGGWTQIGMSEIISPTTLKVWYDRQSGPLNLSFPFRTTLLGAFPAFANFLAAWNAGDNDWHNPFTGGFAAIPGPGRIFLPGVDNIVEIHCRTGDARVRSSGGVTPNISDSQALRTLCQSTPYDITKQSVATAVGILNYNDGWGAWSAGNITDKNQTRTCNAGTGGHCANAYGTDITNHGQTEARPSATFWNNYLVNGPAGHTDATNYGSDDITSVVLTRNNSDGRLQLTDIDTTGGTVTFTTPRFITTGRETPNSGTLFVTGPTNIVLKSNLSRPNLSWTAIPGPGIVFYRPSGSNRVRLLDSSCTASGDLRVRSGTTTNTEQTAQANSPLCNIGASVAAITRQVIGELSATDNYIYAVPATLGAIQDSTPNTPARVDDILTAGALSHPTLTVNINAHQWQRCTTQDCSNATDISTNGTSATYTVQAADHAHWLRVQVTQGGDFNDTLFSNSVQVDRRGAIGPITGIARAGGTLTAGAVTDADASPTTDVGTITHEWQTATASAGPFTAAPGTNNTATYTIASDQSQIGTWLRVMASYPNAGGDSLTSDPVAVAGVRVSPTALNVTEGGDSTSYTLMLSSRPTGPVTLTVTNPDATAVTLSATSLTFTTDNWNSARTVTVSSVEDTDTDHETVQLTHTATSTDPGYNGAAVTIDSVAVTLNDNDGPGVFVSSTTLTVHERGGTGMYTLRLNTPPTEAVTISVTHSNAAAVTVSPTSLMFGTTDWNTAKTITVTGVEDADTDDETVRLTHTVTSTDTTYRTVTAATVTVTVTEIAAVSLDVDGSGGDPNQSDGLLLGRYLFGIRDAAGLLDTIPGSPSASAVTANIAGAFASGRLDVDGSGGDPNQSDGLLLGRYLFGIRDAVGLLDTIPGNPSFNAVRTNIEALLQ